MSTATDELIEAARLEGERRRQEALAAVNLAVQPLIASGDRALAEKVLLEALGRVSRPRGRPRKQRDLKTRVKILALALYHELYVREHPGAPVSEVAKAYRVAFGGHSDDAIEKAIRRAVKDEPELKGALAPIL